MSTPFVAAPTLGEGERGPQIKKSPSGDLSDSSELLPSFGWSSSSSSSSSTTLPWGTAKNSSPSFSPNRVREGQSQNSPSEGSLFKVSPLSPVVLSNRENGMPRPSGVLLPTILDEFNDAVLGEPISYARIEQVPGSDSPLSLPVYAWPPKPTFMIDPIIQTVLPPPPPKPEMLPVGTTWAVPPVMAEKARMTESGIPGCPYIFLESDELPFMDGNPAYGLQLHHPRFLELVGAPESARPLDCAPSYWVEEMGKERAMVAATTLQRDAGVMLSNLQILSQFAMALNRMSFSLMALGLERSLFPGAEVDALTPAPRMQQATPYMSAMGLWHPQENQTVPRPVPTPSCNLCRNCKYCFPDDEIPPERRPLVDLWLSLFRLYDELDSSFDFAPAFFYPVGNLGL